MTTSSDGWDEMHEQPFDEPLLTELLNELRSWGTGPAPAPNAALASLLDAHPAPVPSPPRRKKNMIASKLAGLGIAAKVALGVGVAAAAVTTAGATGVLPPPAQHAVASVVDAVTPLQLPDPSVKTNVNVNTGGSTDDVTIPGSSTTSTTEATDDTTDDTTGGATGSPTTGQPDNHGACVSAIAQDKSTTGRDHGKAVSTAAKSGCGKQDETSSSTSTSSTSSTTTVAGGSSASVNSGSNRGPGNGNPGNGNHGNGNGNSGNSGNSGRD